MSERLGWMSISIDVKTEKAGVVRMRISVTTGALECANHGDNKSDEVADKCTILSA